VTVVWEFVADVAARRRVLLRLRIGVVGLAVVAVAVSLGRFGVLGGLIALAVSLLVAMTVESWGRSAPDAGPQRLWVDAGVLCAEGPDIYCRAPGAEVFELRPGTSPEVVDLEEVAWASVYPSTTRLDDAGPTPPMEFHLVVDLCLHDHERRCVVFDRRIPFRIPGERSLADAVDGLVDAGRRDPDPEDSFGELDLRRLADWSA